MKNKILLNFDIEEFDLPLEYHVNISEEEQLKYSHEGLKKILLLLKKHRISSTFFITGTFAEKFPSLIKEISKNHEVASHNLTHKKSPLSLNSLKKSKQLLEKITSKPVKGFRSPRLSKVNYELLNQAGYIYDSSQSPAFLPGRYYNFFSNKNVHSKNKVIIVPTSVLPFVRLPFFWLFFRFFGLQFSKLSTILCLKNQNYVDLYFHPWEFSDISKLNIPSYIKRNSGDKATKLLDSYIDWCKNKGYLFQSFNDFLNLDS